MIKTTKTIGVFMLFVCMTLTAQAGQNKLVVPSISTTWGETMLPVNIENDDDIVAMQFDLLLPEGVASTSEAVLTSRCSDHSVTVVNLEGRLYRIMLYSDRNSTLAEQTGTVFYLPITISEDIPSETELSLTVNEAVLSVASGENVLTGMEVGTILVTDIPIPDIVNPGFELSQAVTASLEATDAAAGTNYATTGWKLKKKAANANSGVFAYGSSYTLGQVNAPACDNEGMPGHALGITGGWRSSLLYQSSDPVLMPRGTFALLAYVYNANPDAEQIVSRLGFVTTDGESYLSTVTSFPVGEWTIDYVMFTLNTASEGVFQVGCKARNVSPADNAILFFDNILLTDEQDLTARMIAVQLAHFPENYGEGEAMASLVDAYNAARQQMAASANMNDLQTAVEAIKRLQTDIDDYISAKATLTQAIQSVAAEKLSAATLAEAQTLLDGIAAGTLYTNDQIGQLKSDVSSMVSRLNKSVQLYASLLDALNAVNDVLATAGPHTRTGLAEEITQVETSYNTNQNGYNTGSIADNNINDIVASLWQMATQLSNDIANYVDANDWQVLKSVYEQRAQTENWKRTWDFTAGKPWKANVPGVETNDGYVVGLYLSDNNMKGEVPEALLTLPHLAALDLSYNHLTQLNTPIPSQVSGVSLYGQTMDYVVNVSVKDLADGLLATKLPSILLYRHSTQTFDAPLTLSCINAANDWAMVIDKDSEGNASIGGTSTLTYKEENDAMFSVSSGDGSTFSLKLHFDDGDSNFDGLVDILDLQTSINYAFNNCDKLFNFTAANLRADDDVINVQDVVKEVDLLMATSSNSREAISYSRAMDSNYDNYNFCQDETAIIGISDGCLWIDTQTPVAAFDLTLSTECGLQVNNALRQLGLTCTMQQQENGLRIIGYSLTGFTLPIGRTVIGTIADENAVLMRALLSDPEAVPIGVAADNGQTTGIIDAPLDLWSLATKGTQERSTFNVQRYYDLQGRRVSKSAKKGVYIMHDMKILKK